MHIEVTEESIDLFGMCELTGETKEFLLAKAAEAIASGHTLSIDVPIDRNVFDSRTATPVDPQDLEHGTNPIENSQAEGVASEQEEFHSCELPPNPVPGNEFTCRWCRRKYYAETDPENAAGVGTWIIQGELM